jgi:hypothetical protein
MFCVVYFWAEGGAALLVFPPLSVILPVLSALRSVSVILPVLSLSKEAHNPAPADGAPAKDLWWRRPNPSSADVFTRLPSVFCLWMSS